MQSSSLSGSKMLKFIWGKGHQPSQERIKLQKDLFGFQKVVRHGFPNKPSSMAWDHELKLLALATKQGALRIYGSPGVEFYGQHENDQNVIQMVFLPGQGKLVSLTDDNILHLWEIKKSKLMEKKTASLDGRLKKISVLCLEPDNLTMLLGTEGGNIYELNLSKFVIEEDIIYQDIVMKGAPEDFKVNPGAVEGLLVKPNQPDQLLIGYARGLVVLWNRATKNASQTFVSSQQLESLAWRNDASQFVSAHNDGSFVVWSTQGNTEPLEPPNAPYGPYPCKAINKILWAHDNGNSWLVFGGGMPRASYGDKCTVTLMQGEEKHVVFDLTSKIVDFELLYETPPSTSESSPSTSETSPSSAAPTTLLILAEEEMVAIDLTTDNYSVFNAPYLNSIHASAITCLTHVDDVTNDMFEKISQTFSSSSSGKEKVTDRAWPVTGGVPTLEAKDNTAEAKHELLLTGHEDGSVKVWNCEGVSLRLMGTFKTNKYFVGDDLDAPPPDDDDDDEWPPFRKVGHFDPYSDDPRLAVKKMTLCPQSGRLVVGGTAGQIVVCQLSDEATEQSLLLVKSDLVTEKEGFAWKGHSALTVKTDEVKMEPGFQPTCVVQISPPASINSLGCCGEWGLVAAGTAHGLVIFDLVQNVNVLTKCTLNAQDIANADDNPMSRRKSLKKSLRESFRRLRKGRSQRNVDKKRPAANNITAINANTTDPIKKELRSESPESRPLERQVEARSGSEDGLGSMVRCIHFAKTYIANPQTLSTTIWAGTNSGQVLVFLVTLPSLSGEKRQKDKVSAMLGKEIQLKHKAPVIAIEVLDASGMPVNVCGGSGGDTDSGDMGGAPHKVFIASEEQFKTFLLPTLKPCGKYKLTAHEGARIRRVGFTKFRSRSDREYSENCLVCLTNQGDLTTHSLPELRRQVQTNCIKREDVIAISTMVLTPKGEAFYLCSSSELQRVSVAAAHELEPRGMLALSEATAATPTNEHAPAETVAANDNNGEEDESAGPMAVAVAVALASASASLSPPAPPAAVPATATATTPTTIVTVTDPHNDTTISEISADITLDSVKDHTVSHAAETTITEVSSSASGVCTEVTRTTTTTTTATTAETTGVIVGEGSGEENNAGNSEANVTVIKTTHVETTSNTNDEPQE